MFEPWGHQLSLLKRVGVQAVELWGIPWWILPSYCPIPSMYELLPNDTPPLQPTAT